MPEVVKFIGYKWVFIGKCNEKNEIMRLGIDYEETYSGRDLVLIMRKHILL